MMSSPSTRSLAGSRSSMLACAQSSPTGVCARQSACQSVLLLDSAHGMNQRHWPASTLPVHCWTRMPISCMLAGACPAARAYRYHRDVCKDSLQER